MINLSKKSFPVTFKNKPNQTKKKIQTKQNQGKNNNNKKNPETELPFIVSESTHFFFMKSDLFFYYLSARNHGDNL